jgi:rod shape determining protein RodA
MKLSGGMLRDYHFKRIISFLNKDKTDDLYMQTYNSLVAIATGNLKGKGLGNGVLNNLGFIPNRDNDFIFSAIGEELGFIGCVSILFLMFLIIVKLFLIANRSYSNLGRLIVVGIVGMFAFQSFVNAAVATDLIVNTGMTFPFLSSGGSSMLVNMICVGLAINVGMEKPKSMFEG